MISHKYRCIYIDVPKTGSTSIRSIVGVPPRPHLDICQLRSRLQDGWTRYGRWMQYGGVAYRIASAANQLLSPQWRERAGERVFRSYFKFGFVRNPWDRVVSLYQRREGVQLKGRMSFEEFVDWLQYSSGTCLHPGPHVNQLDWFCDSSGEILVDFIGRFENLAADWRHVALRIGAPPELPHLNRNTAADSRCYTEFYTSRTREVVARRFQRDIEFFGYSFGDAATTEDARS